MIFYPKSYFNNILDIDNNFLSKNNIKAILLDIDNTILDTDNNMLEGIEVKLDTNFFDNIDEYKSMATKIVYTGPIDEYFNYSLGELDWRSLRFETQILDEVNHQGNAVVNYTGHEVDYTRVIEHKHFEFDTTSPKTVVTYEYPADYEKGMEKYYTVNDDKNNELADKYRELASKEENIIFGGRLAEYKYYDMDDVIKSAFDTYKKEA